MIPASHSASTHDRIAFDQLATFSSLFSDYSQFTPQIAPFFSGDHRNISAFEAQTQRTLDISRDRNAVADVLLKQNTRWGLDDAVRNNIERLRSNESVVVITGQQLGLFLSPLYIPYKTLTTIRLAAELSDSLQRPVVPVFWLHGEDHDFEETAPFTLINEHHELTSIRYQPVSNSQGPVGRMQFEHSIEELIQSLKAHLPQTPNKNQVLDFLQHHFTQDMPLLDAFAFLLKRIFKDSGLVLFSPDDATIKQLCKPLYRQEIQDPLRLTQAVESTSERLAQSYYKQVQTNPINLFLMDDEHRQSITLQEDRFKIKGHSHSYSSDELLTRLDQHPEQFSPNVILRPITQDFIFPSIAYIAGPGEIAYFAQCKEAYEAAGIPMPIIYPRASITLIEPNINRVLDRYPYAFSEYNEHPLKLFRQYAINQLPIDLETAVDESIDRVNEALHALRDTTMNVHPTLHTSAESTKVRFSKELLKYKEQVIKAQKRNEFEHKAHLHKAATHLFPNQKLQERVLSPLHFLNLYGLDFFNSLMDEISLDTTAHQIIRL
ncbi:MAG: bacillithiol biosynthesis cysteine-adding enzyme BshC [Rhodothermaceae bacterium]|nr:bacillithiol biosynthesis cysteine-adding enzyme BshC [Rhodothermaceae bacterium]